VARAARPLNPDAVREANETLWQDNPELNRRQLTMGPEDYEYRRQWMRAYQQALARRRRPSSGRGGAGGPGRPCQPSTLADLGATVTRVNDGQPVEGARVEITGPESRAGTTGTDGTVVFSGVQPGSYTVTGSKTNYTTETTAATASPGTTSTATLELTAQTDLGVTVTDAATHNAIQGATVRISGPQAAESPTDASGTARFIGIATGNYRIEATQTGYRAGRADATVNEGSTQATVQLTAVGGLGGTVQDADSRAAVEGATVTVQERPALSATTDAAGRYNFPDIDAGTYHLLARKPGYTDGTATATVDAARTQTADIQVRRLALEITDGAGTVLTGTQTKIVGQKVQLRLRTNPAGQAISNVRWTIPGQTVKTYTQSAAAGTRTDLTPADLQAASVDFYWIDGGNKQVQVSATVAGSNMTASLTFNVLAPTGVTMTSVTGTVAVSNPGFPGAGLELHFGTNATPGIAWTCRATAPAGGTGQIAATQLDEVRHERTLNDGTRQTRNPDPAGVYRLDTKVPYAAPVAIAAGGQATSTTNDSPGGPLTAALRQYRSRANFRLYFMYKPDGADSIWVTIGRLDWNWTGETTRVGAPASADNNWNPPLNVANSVNPSGVASTELPIWTANVTGLSWP
jgi:hypothetical protein